LVISVRKEIGEIAKRILDLFKDVEDYPFNTLSVVEGYPKKTNEDLKI